MGLDVYVGTLTRYYARAWETTVQRLAREKGWELEVVRPDGPPPPAPDPHDVEPAMIAWRAALNESLGSHLSMPLDWVEGMAPPYFTDKPAWDCYSALLVWAAHEEQGDPHLPAVAPEDWTSDPAVRRSEAEGFESRYGQLLYGPEWWLPGDYGFTFRTPAPTGTPVVMGATGTLAAQLRELNARTWRADDATIDAWRRDGADFGAPLERSARLAFAVFTRMVEEAEAHRLPMLLDY